MSSAVEAPTLCPECGATLPVDPGYSSWCEGCGWNVDPYPPAPPADRRGRRTARFLAKLDAQLRASAENSRRVRPIPSVVTGIALAAAVHALTLALAATAVWLAALGPLAAFVRWPLAVAIGAIVLLVVPRVPRLPRAAIPLTRDGTPGLWRLTDQVAAAANAPVPSAIVATDAFAGELRIVGVRRRRVLNLGLAAWMTLKPQERVAFLAYELTKTQSGGRLRDVFVGAAVSSLRGWQRVLQPMTVDHRAIETAISWQKDGSGFTLPSTLDVAFGRYGAARHDDPVRDPTIIRAGTCSANRCGGLCRAWGLEFFGARPPARCPGRLRRLSWLRMSARPRQPWLCSNIRTCPASSRRGGGVSMRSTESPTGQICARLSRRYRLANLSGSGASRASGDSGWTGCSHRRPV